MKYEEKYDPKKIKFLNGLTFEDYVEVSHKDVDDDPDDIKSNFKVFRNFMKKCVKCPQGFSVEYEQNNSRGRWYTKKNPSIQPINKYVRGFLCDKITTDIDIKNCYPVILEYICRENNILCPVLSHYVTKREDVFSKFPEEKEVIKTQIFTIIFGGKPKLSNNFMIQFNSEYENIKKEVEKLEMFKSYFEKVDKTKKNREGTAMFRIIEDIEIKIMTETIKFLGAKNIEIFAYMFDGCMVHGNYYEKMDLLEELNVEINSKFPNLNVEFAYKKHIIDEVIMEKYDEFLSSSKDDEDDDEEILNSDSYVLMKKSFEKRFSKIINSSVFIKEYKKNGRVCDIKYFPENKLNISYRHLTSEEEEGDGKITKTSFMKQWLCDPKIRSYDDEGIFPPGVKIPKNCYNIWRDFEMEFIDEYVEKKEELEMILNHIKILCDNNNEHYEYVIKWISFLIKYPALKSTCLVFISKEGAGKGTLMGILKKMLGEKKIFETTQPDRDVWGTFNPAMGSAYLVNINELSKTQQTDAIGKIKGLITDPTFELHGKFEGVKVMNSYHKFIISTNSTDPVYTNDDDRRFVIIRSSDEKIGDFEYFIKLNEIMGDENVIKTCYEYFKNYEVSKNFPFEKRPETDYHKNLKIANKSVFVSFLEFFTRLHLSQNVESKSYYANEIYMEFVKWRDDNGIKYEVSSLKLMCNLKNSRYEGIDSKKERAATSTIFNFIKLAKSLRMDGEDIKPVIKFGE